jgi:hypothetical protein
MTPDNSDDNAEREPLAILVEQFQKASGATTADRAVKDQLLDELQEAVGLSGKMVTEADIIRRAEKLLRGK